MVQLTQFLRRASQLHPRGIATHSQSAHRTWLEFQSRVERLATGFRSLGLKTGDRVAILALNSDRYLESFFGLSWAGLVFVPINLRLALPEMAFWVQDSGCKAIIVDQHNLTNLCA